MAWKRETTTSIAARIKRISDKSGMNKNLYVPSIDNYRDSDGVPQPHIDGEVQKDYVYDYYIDRGIEPPWFEDYKQRKPGIPVNWDYVSHSLQDGRTKDETAYLIRKYEREHNDTLEGCPYNYNKTF